MQKSIIALVVAAMAAGSASAANIYNKDGTTLDINGRVQAVFYSGKNGAAANDDSTISNSGRLGFSGRTQLTDGIYGFAYTQWNASNGDSSNDFKARDQYIGADFGEFGTVKMGRFLSAIYYVTQITDVYEDYGALGQFGDSDRLAGQLAYSWSGYGATVNLTYQSAKDDAAVEGAFNGEEDGTASVESAFTVTAGYDTPSVVFGPISIRAGYEYFKGQDDYTADGTAKREILDNMKGYAVSLGWGDYDSGLYLALVGQIRDFSYEGNVDYKMKGAEFLVSYALDCGVTLQTGYSWVEYDPSDKTDDSSFKAACVPMMVNYSINSNFNVWAEARFNAGSDADNERSFGVYDRNAFNLGARYTF